MGRGTGWQLSSFGVSRGQSNQAMFRTRNIASIILACHRRGRYWQMLGMAAQIREPSRLPIQLGPPVGVTVVPPAVEIVTSLE